MRRLLSLLLLAVVAAQPAAGAPPVAHPFGPPPSARVRAEGRTLIVDWTSAPDDAIAVGEELGVLPEGSTQAYREGAAVTQVAPSRASEEQLSRSELLKQYLRERISATQDGAACTSDVAPIGDFVANGARVVVTCPEPVTRVELKIAMLTDIHDAYRTFAVGQRSTPKQFVYTLERPSQVWQFGEPAAAPAASQAVPAAIATLIVAGAGVAAWWLLQRRRRADAADR